jgi:hypothetical protein
MAREFTAKQAARRTRAGIRRLRTALDGLQNDWGDIDMCMQGVIQRAQQAVNGIADELEDELKDTIETAS